MFVVEKESERREWEAIFSNACRNTLPPLSGFNLNYVLHQAIKLSSRKYGIFDHNLLNDTEISHLQFYFYQIVYREKLLSIYERISSKQPEGDIPPTTLNMINTVINNKIFKLSEETWKKCLEKYTILGDSFSLNGNKNNKDILFIEHIPTYVISKLEHVIGDRVDFVFDDLKERVITPFNEQTIPLLTSAYTQTVITFYNEIFKLNKSIDESISDSILNSNEKMATSLTEKMIDIESSLDKYFYNNSTYLIKAQASLWEWYTECLSNFSDMYRTSDEVFRSYLMVIDSLREIIRNALYTYRTKLSNYSIETRNLTIFSVLQSMTIDLKLVYQDHFLMLNRNLLELTAQVYIIRLHLLHFKIPKYIIYSY